MVGEIRGTNMELQVTGDLWERYLKLIDDGIADGYGTLLLMREAIGGDSIADMEQQRRDGRTGSETLLLPPHGHDTRRLD